MKWDIYNSTSSYRLIALLLFFSQVLYSQQNVLFDHITTNDGLSQSDINSIYQDKQGFMWFCTHDGLNKYDGYDFTIYNPDTENENSISSNLTFCATGDSKGNLWIGTTGRGLNYFDTNTGRFTTYKHDVNDPNSIASDYISALYIDDENRLWVGTSKGLNMLDLSKNKDERIFQRFNFEEETLIINFNTRPIGAIYEDSKGQLLAGGQEGLYKLTRDSEGKNYFRSITTALGIPKVMIRSVAEDTSGRLIIGTEDGLYMQSKDGTGKAFKLEDGQFTSLLIDKNDHIWAGSNEGLYYYENFTNQDSPVLSKIFTYDPREPNSISKNVILSLFMDKTGVIWVGTNGGGVNKFDPERKQFIHVRKNLNPTSLSYDKIRSIFEDSNGTLWIGTEGGGLNMLAKNKDDGSYLGFKHYKSILKPFTIVEFQEKGKKTLLIGGESNPGFYKLDITNPKEIVESDLKVLDIPSSVFSLCVDSDNTIWIGTYRGGLHRWKSNGPSEDYSKEVFTHSENNPTSISNDIIRNIYEDSHKNLWIATGDGLSMLSQKERSKKQPVFKVYKNNPKNHKSLTHNYILSLYESNKGELWIGTFGGGLNKFIPGKDNKEDSFISYSDKDGLPNNIIKGILEDDNNNLWLSTNKGLTRFNVEKEEFKNYDVDDGLQSNEFQELACLKRKDGEMMFGGINGFNTFYPERISENIYQPETVITNFSISNKPIKVGSHLDGKQILHSTISETKELELRYKDNSFSFEFASLHYASPNKNKFSYMLEGFDEDWVQTTSDKRFATYTNISPGDYTFKVKSTNNDGVWDETAQEIKIVVTPPFWRSTLAYIFYGLLGIGLLWLFWRYTFITTTEKHQLDLEHLQNEKSHEMQQIKLEFFTNISHEFRTPLTLIKGPLEYLQKKGHQLSTNKLKEQYSLMQKNTDYLMRLVNQLLDFRKMGQGKMRLVVRNTDISEFVREVGEPFQFLAHKQGINFKVHSTNSSLYTWFDHEALEKILNNLLSNAFKFTPESGRISVEVKTGKEYEAENGPKLENDVTDHIVLQVKDTGSGIPKESVDHIFERFYIEKDRSEQNLNGAGIGLSFVKNLVELHQGQIHVVSEPNKETNFIVTLPIKKEVYEYMETITVKEESDGDYRIRSSEAESFAIGLNDEIVDRNISQERPKLPVLLVVDDNKDIRSFIKNSLEEKYTIYEAENGKEGFELALSIVPNVILTDVVMPEMNGMEFCEKIKTKSATSHIPVMMITAKSSQESEIQGLQNGADDYIRKPFDMELLEIKLANIMKQRDELRKRFNRDINLRPKEVTVTSTDELFLQQAIEIVEKHMMNTDFNVEMLVKEMGHSRSNLYLKFKEITGLSSSEFIRNIRLKRAVQLFDSSDFSVKEIMYMTGFNTASYFSKCFKKQFGVIPSEYVAQMKRKKSINA